MKVVIQRVLEASVVINNQTVADIKSGLLILLGIVNEDSTEDIDWLCKKIINLRIFPDENYIMNRSLLDAQGEIIVVSQFTLPASVKKGRRPDFTNAAKPEIAEPLYQSYVDTCKSTITHVETGEFGADMQVELVNDGPVTLIIDSCTA